MIHGQRPVLHRLLQSGVLLLMKRGENRAVMAVMAAVAGVGFSSGREMVLFFAQMERASWIGIVLSSAMFAMMCTAACSYARQTGKKRLADVFAQVLGPRLGAAVRAIYSLLMALAAGVMLTVCGKMAMLALPFRNAFRMGMLLALSAALLLNMKNMAKMPLAGLAAVLLCGMFHTALAVDRRPVTIHLEYVTVPRLSGSMAAAVLMAVLHSSLAASVAGGVAVRFAGECENPVRFGTKCGISMLLMLTAANGAVLSGGKRLLSQAMPTVVLAARWGIAGYYISLFAMWLCALTTLAAALGSLGGIKRKQE